MKSNESKEYKQLRNAYMRIINDIGTTLEDLPDDQIREKIQYLASEINQDLIQTNSRKPNNKGLLEYSQDLFLKHMPQTFALVRESSRRILNMWHYDVQIIGGIAMQLGNIIEMKNGEGKTIVALLPVILNALFSKYEYHILSNDDPGFMKRSVHIMTSNDYLARRDYVWLKPLYDYWEISVGYIQERNPTSPFSMGISERQAMYTADVVYGSAKEFIFDYLRDNLGDSVEKQVQGGRYFVVVDEADHVLLDEARTPHVISGEVKKELFEDVEVAYLVNHLANRMVKNNSLISVDQDYEPSFTWSGKQIIRILFGQMLRSTESIYFPGIPEKIHFLGFIMQFTNSIANRAEFEMGDDDYSVLGYISQLSQWTENHCRFFERDENGEISGFSTIGYQTLKDYVHEFLQNMPDENSTFRDFIQIPTLAFRFLPTMINLFQQNAVERYGITRQDLIDFQKEYRGKLVKLILSFSRKEASLEPIANWIVKFIESYLIDAAKLSLNDESSFYRFVRAVFVFLDAFLPGYPRGEIPGERIQHISQLCCTLLGRDTSENVRVALGPDAIIDVAEMVAFPVVSHLLNPSVETSPKDIFTVLVLMTLRVLSDAAKITNPRTRSEKQMLELFSSISQIVPFRLFNLSDQDDKIELSRWGQIIVDDYGSKIIEEQLWLGDESLANNELKLQTFLPKLRFFVDQSLKAQVQFIRDEDYVIQPANYRTFDEFSKRYITHEIVIVGKLTGRMMPGRRWNNWLHSFIEAKEGLPVKQDLQSKATISTKGYIAQYLKLAGMTGTATIGSVSPWAATFNKISNWIRVVYGIVRRKPINLIQEPHLTYDPVKLEFENVYQTSVIVIPQNRPPQRQDLTDRVFASDSLRLRTAAKTALDLCATGQPVLVETSSIRRSQYFADLLKTEVAGSEQGIKINLLNALLDEREAEVVGNAGLPGTITVSTQITGRGTDIVLSTEAIEKGGLYVIGIERRQSRRWDDQIAGRAGRQGEPGSTRFFVSIDDPLLRRFTPDWYQNWMKDNVGEHFEITSEGVLVNKLMTSSIKTAQIRFEHISRNQRERTAAFDRIVGQYREEIYALRQQTLFVDYLCPACGERSISVTDKKSFCDGCESRARKQGIDLYERIPQWRSYLDGIIFVAVDSFIENITLEHYLVNKYSSDVTSPATWDYENIMQELNRALPVKTRRTELVNGIDFQNELYPGAEQKTLQENIKNILISAHTTDLVVRSMAVIERHGSKYGSNTGRWIDDQWTTLCQRLSEILIQRVSKEQLLAQQAELHLKKSVDRERLRHVIQRFAERRVWQQDWIYSLDANVLPLVNFFNPLLQKDFQISQAEALEALGGGKIKMLIQQRLLSSYRALVEKHTRPVVNDHENTVLRHLIDKNWQNMLTEIEEMTEEYSTTDFRSDVIGFGVGVAKLFQTVWYDLARDFLCDVFEEEIEPASSADSQAAEPNIRYGYKVGAK